MGWRSGTGAPSGAVVDGIRAIVQGYRLISDTVTPMRYREVIHAPLWLLIIIYFFLLSIAISVWAALGNNPALATLVVVTALLILFYSKSALIVEVDGKELRVGKAHIELSYLGEVRDLNNEAMRLVRTRDADPNAHLAIRFWVNTGVQIFINDARDSTPYWLISSKQGENLIKAIKG
jgi:hypothetical protein